MYNEVGVVNKGFAWRTCAMCTKDAGINVTVMLDTLPTLARLAIGKEWWKDIESLIAPCIGEMPVAPIAGGQTGTVRV